MFRKPPLKTYQRKKAGGPSTTINLTSIIREDISENKDLQPKEFLAFKDSDKSLEYDPFDTTFDRIARDVKMPPIPQNPADDSYSSSSSDINNSSLNNRDLEPLPDPLPIINPKPVSVRRKLKKLKLDELVPTVRIQKLGYTVGKRKKYRNTSSLDENTEPNIEQKSGKRNRNIKDSKEPKNVVPKKKSRLDKKPVVSTHRGRIDKNLVRSKRFKHCSVNLTRVDIPSNKSMADSNLTDDILNDEKMAVSEHNKEETPEEVIKDQSISLREKNTFKNPTVSLTRLNVPRPRASVANKIWLNSTPIDRRTARPKSSLHFSPISTDKSMETADLNEGNSYEGQNLPPEKRNIPLKYLTPKKSKALKFPNRKKVAPISTDKFMETTDRNENNSYEGQNLPPGKSNVQLKYLTPKKLKPAKLSNRKSMKTTNRDEDDSYEEQNLPSKKENVQSKNSRFSNRSKRIEKNSIKSRPLLSDSPDPEPSGLMFDDTEMTAPSSNSYASLEENENAAEVSATSPFKGFSKGPPELSVAVSRTASRDVLAPIENDSHVMEASETSLLKGFKKDSTDSGSLHLTFDESDKTETSSKELADSLRKARPHSSSSSASTENRTEATASLRVFEKDQPNISATAKNQRSSLQKSATDLQNSSKESVEGRQNSSKDSTKDLQNTSEETTEVLHNISNESAKDRQASSKEKTKNLITPLKKNLKNRRSNSENRPTLLKENKKNRQSVQNASAYDTKNISKDIAKDWEKSSDESSENTTEQLNSDDEWETTMESPKSNLSSAKSTDVTTTRRTDSKSILQVSSDNTSCDDPVEFVNVRQSSSQTKYDNQELSSFETDESSKVEIFSENKAKTDESSAVEKTYDQKLLKNLHRKSLQPVVLLSRWSVPIRGSKKTSNHEKMRLKKANDSMESIKELSSESEDEDMEKSMVQSSVAESMEWKNEDEESQESQGDMASLKVDEVSGSTAKIEESAIAEVSDGDLSKRSFRLSMIEVGNASESSSKKMEVDDTRKEEESFEAAEVSARKSQVEETPVKMLDKDTLDESRRSIQPVVLLNRLNDPVRIGDRRKKYHNWGLSAISEDITEKNVTTIDEEPEDLETADMEKNETKESEINKAPVIKLSGDRKTIISQDTTISCDASVLLSQSNASIREDKMVFLKPGKSWSRSLSLYRQVHSQDDLESLAFGKGKKWRQSVQTVLDMQQQGVIQSCVRKNADDKESRSCYGVRNSAAAWIPGSSQPDTSRLFSQSSVGSPGRFIRRISIRVVPDRKNSELYEDSPFLEAYGITSCENRKTIGKRSTLIAPRKTLVYNVKCADVSFENIPKTLNNVTSRDVVLAQCGQDTSVPFEEFYPDSYLRYCRKIGEGVFGEVFLYERGTVKNVIKIIPIEGELKVNGERQKKFDEILSEIVIAKELNNLRFADTCKTSSFVEVKNIRCVVGKYPPMLIDLWNTFDNEKNSENDCPDMFDKNQLYIVLELGHGGQDLEAFVFQNSSEAHALFIQTALALAVAEDALEFEHRDLHWGNILISRTEDSQIDYKLRNKDIRVLSKGVKVSVIDFTLSRMSYQGCSIFNDLSLDDDLFAAQGEYQFEIYRLMRQKVENNWQTFEPYTNILWLHYTLDKMITAVRYKRTASKIHKKWIGKLNELKDGILDYKSAFDFVTNCDNVTRLQASRSNVSTVSSTD